MLLRSSILFKNLMGGTLRPKMLRTTTGGHHIFSFMCSWGKRVRKLQPYLKPCDPKVEYINSVVIHF